MKVIGFAGWSGSGKTTLIERLIAELGRRGLAVSVIKHAHKGFAIDRDGSDSQRLRAAGADEVMLSGARRWALLHQAGGVPDVEDCLAHLAPCDLVIVEGFKRYAMPKIEVHRQAHGRPLLAPEDDRIVAVATDAAVDTPLPQLDLNDIAAIADFVVARFGLAATTPAGATE